MTEVWGDPSNWTQQQWLAAVIMMFVIVASIVMVLRLFSIFRMAGKSSYKPNLRRLRRNRVGHMDHVSDNDQS